MATVTLHGNPVSISGALPSTGQIAPDFSLVKGDLSDATPIHVLLQRLLGLPTPAYHHHRLIRDAAGKRLAKRDDARSLASYRDAGWTARALIARLRDFQLAEDALQDALEAALIHWGRVGLPASPQGWLLRRWAAIPAAQSVIRQRCVGR